MINDKSLIEVWKWKEEVSDFLIKLTLSQRLKKIRQNAEKRLLSKKKLMRAQVGR